ncbi:hypothetical protein EJ07DRAFT_165892 [Lizonia empirigonia]|nr:hypothetical protein EJ07DRAFT_165892 [Lizonia empirigonia]
MLRTCRQIYSEAIEYLHTSNAFSLSTWDDDYPTMDYLSYYFLPHRLTQIRDLRIDWEVDNFYYDAMLGLTPHVTKFEAWEKSWAALCALTGLRKLRIILYFRWRDVRDYYEGYWKQHEVELLHPVKSITAPTDFVVVLPDRRCSTTVDVGDSKCILQIPE